MRRALPWLCVIAVLPIVVIAMYASTPEDCSDAAGLREGDSFSQVGLPFVSRCEITGPDGTTRTTPSVVNWLGIAGGLALIVFAWTAGALLAGRGDRRRLQLAMLAALLAGFATLVIFFA